MTLASVGSAVDAVCRALKNEIAKRATADGRSPIFGEHWKAGVAERADRIVEQSITWDELSRHGRELRRSH